MYLSGIIGISTKNGFAFDRVKTSNAGYKSDIRPPVINSIDKTSTLFGFLEFWLYSFLEPVFLRGPLKSAGEANLKPVQGQGRTGEANFKPVQGQGRTGEHNSHSPVLPCPPLDPALFTTSEVFMI